VQCIIIIPKFDYKFLFLGLSYKDNKLTTFAKLKFPGRDFYYEL